jgi:hypothetical protein
MWKNVAATLQTSKAPVRTVAAKLRAALTRFGRQRTRRRRSSSDTLQRIIAFGLPA